MSEKLQEVIRHFNAAAETEAFAEEIGQRLSGGEVIELIGDVGAGKTTFVRGLARGAGSEDRVSSPTFTVTNIYEAPHVRIHHYDFYRLDDVAIMQSEVAEVLEEDKSVVVMEWADSISDIVPEDHIRIKFKTVDESSRELMITTTTKNRKLFN